MKREKKEKIDKDSTQALRNLPNQSRLTHVSWLMPLQGFVKKRRDPSTPWQVG
jgi:hypothetical protein